MGLSSAAAIEEQEHQLQDGTLVSQMRKDDPFSSHSLGDGGIISEEDEATDQEHAVISDPGRNLAVSENRDVNGSNIQEFKDDDDYIIPSPMLKDDSIASFFGPDFTSSLHLLGTKYNGLVKKCQERTAEIDKLRATFESSSNKCVQEWQSKYDTLMSKYTHECSERKRLYNEIIELRGNIRVFCRCRPLSLDEISKGAASVVEFDPHHDSGLQVICSDNTKKQFRFDRVFNPNDHQEVVFSETLPVVKSVLDGYNVCIFAYGQTGTGKTFTMEGTPEHRGVNYRALEELFKSYIERSSMSRYEFFVSMLEVYNEKIRDLLTENPDQDAKKLDVKQVDGIQDVPGLVEARVCSMDTVWELLKTGGKNRSVGSTNANEQSSRSHCLVRVTVKGENLLNGQRSKSHMWLVDLAGSERVGKTEVEGERLRESQFINKSLSALGDVISALVSKNSHVPYRNSKLTHLLQSSLGGDCKTLMFTQISPSSTDLGETLCSLNFATRVRGIESGPARKQSDLAESLKFKQMVEKLRQDEKEIARLNGSLQLMQVKYASRENVFKTLQDKIRDLESQLADQKAKVQTGNRDSAKHFRPPLPPIRDRKPLSRITNRLPPGGSQRTSTHDVPAFENKENVLGSRESLSAGQLKAQRISLAHAARSVPAQPRRRASIATLPTEAERHRFASQSRVPRRKTIAPFPETPLALTNPRGKGVIGRFNGTLSSSSKYSSPTRMQAVWKSRIPTFASPRPRFQLVPSPTVSGCPNDSSSQSKLCFSVQKRVAVCSPAAQARNPFLMAARAIRDHQTIGRLGTAQRVLVGKKRRQSVI